MKVKFRDRTKVIHLVDTNKGERQRNKEKPTTHIFYISKTLTIDEGLFQVGKEDVRLSSL